MNFSNLFKIAVKALLRNKGRAILTMLGIVIGIASVITMVSLGQSSTLNVKQELSSMGSNMIMISPARQHRGGVNMGNSNSKSLTLNDYNAIKTNARYVSKVSPTVAASAQAVYGANNHPASIQGISPDYLDIRKYELEKGVLFSEKEVTTYAKVCIIGQTIVENLFPDGSNPIGATIRFGSIPMKVVGVLASKGESQMGQDQDDIVFAPYTTVQKRFSGINHLNMITASAISEEESELAATDITQILRNTHTIAAGADDDFEVFTQEELLTTVSSVTQLLTVLLSAIAAISLIVGGIGIMNIMYVTVTERTKEIGLRMAIGAHKRDIMMQFLFESVILSLIGGVIGIIFGLIAAYAVSSLLGWPYVVSEMAIVASFLVCAATGVFFGWYPAKRAANLDPITAIRYE
ncbi:MAG: ABC transporter permease [Bacteroidales bacterium]|nr:ABC transporter permease [Bacteroidales bacterium]